MLRTNLFTASPFHSKAEITSRTKPTPVKRCSFQQGNTKRHAKPMHHPAMINYFKGIAGRYIALRVASQVCHAFHCHASTHYKLSVCVFQFRFASLKATSNACINWLACDTHSAAWLLRPSGHGFCSALHACHPYRQSHKHLLTLEKQKHMPATCVYNIAVLRPPLSGLKVQHLIRTRNGSAHSVCNEILHPLLLTLAQGCFTAKLCSA